MRLQNIRRTAWMLTCAFLGCESGALIDVHLTGRPVEARSLLVSAELNGVAAIGTGQQLVPSRDYFRVRLEPSGQATLKLNVDSQDLDGCNLATGSGSLPLTGSGHYSIDIALESQLGCSLVVELVGPGSGQVISSPAGIDCGTSCTYRFPHNLDVGLLPRTADRFGGWFTDAGTPSCAGRVSCALQIGSGVTRVRANFIHASACTPTGWCVEEELPPESSPRSLYALWGSSRDDVWAVGDSGEMLRSDGVTWHAASPSSTRALRSIWGFGPSDVWAVGEAGTVLHFDGSAWLPAARQTAGWLNGIWGSSRNSVWAVGDFGTILHFDGTRWSRVESGTTRPLRAVWGSSAYDVWAVGDDGTVLRFGGALWEPINTPNNNTEAFYSVWGTGANNIWIVGDRGIILHWSGGFPLELAENRGGSALYGVWGASPSQTWAVGDGGLILLWNGSAWNQVAQSPSSSHLAGIWGSSALDVWVVGQGPGIYRYRP